MKFPTRYLLMPLLILFSQTLHPQIILTLPAIQSCPGPVVLPIQAQSFNNVASVSMKIKFDSTVLIYEGHTDLNPAFNTGMFLINSVHQEVIFSWFSLNPITLGDANLINLHFRHLINSNTAVSWNKDTAGYCVITDLSGEELPLELFDAILTTTFNKPVPINPPDQAVEIAENPLFHWNGSGCGPHYTLIYSKDPDFLTETIIIDSIFGTNYLSDSLEYNTTYFWKVKALILGTAYSTEWSETYSFTTKQANSLPEESRSIFQIQLYPVPAKEELHLQINTKQKIRVNIQITDLSGRNIYHPQEDIVIFDSYLHTINISNLKTGTYTLIAEASTSVERGIRSIKFSIIK